MVSPRLNKTSFIPLALEDCTGHTLSSSDNGRERTLAKNDFFCFDGRSAWQTLLVLGSGLKFEAIDPNSKTETISKNNGYGASALYVKVSNPGDEQKVTPYFYPLQLSMKEGEQEAKQILVMKKEWEQTITTKGEENSGVSETIHVINPLKSKVTVNPGDGTQITIDLQGTNTIDKEQTFEDFIVSVMAYPKGDETEGTYKADITVEASKTPANYPEKVALLENGKLYSTDDEDYDDFEGGGLSAGAIAGIVIACVVVVGVVVFCIVWFVVLKKGCCCGGKGSDASA